MFLQFTVHSLQFTVRSEKREERNLSSYFLSLTSYPQDRPHPTSYFLRRIFHLLLLTALCSTAFAQKISLKGVVKDTADRPLEGATVMLMEPKDSSLVTFGRSQTGGVFELKNLNSQSYLLKITYMGLRPYSRLTQPTDSDLGLIKMEAIPKDLNEVVVRGERNPVEIVGDTIAYNAGSFKVQPNAVVEDLLKRLPGVEVSRDGTITAQGQTVKRVTVDGKEFFGRDPKVATRNLPADAVDKVKVFDRQSDQASFTGIDDGQREKTIDLKIKEEKKKMAFGNIMGGAGPDARYTGRANINKFNKARQFSFLGMANNVNQQGFSIEDYMNFSGAARQMMSGGGMRFSFNSNDDTGIPLNFGGRTNGFQTTWAAGVNYNDKLSKKTDIQSNYFYSRSDQLVDKEVNRQNFLPGRTFLSNQNTAQKTFNESHRLNLTLDHKLDSANTLRWTNNLSLGNSSTNIGSSTQNFLEGAGIQNDNERSTLSQGNNTRLNSELLWRHRFAKKGRNFSVIATLGYNENDRNGTLRATNRFFGPTGSVQRIDTLRQTNTQQNERLNYGLTLSFTEPLGRKQYLETNYAFQLARTDVDRQVFDVRPERAPVFNRALSNQFKTDFSFHKAGMNYRFAGKEDNLTVGAGVQQSQLEGDLILQNVNINRSFLNLLPQLRYTHNYSNSKSLNVNYDTDVQAPDIQQLSPIIDNSDPLNIMEGNPNLRPEYQHRLSAQFNSFNALTFNSFFANLNFMYTTNKISMAQWVADNLVRTYRPVNMRDDYNLFGNISKGFRLKALKTRLNFNTSLTLNRGLALVNDVENRTRRFENRNTLRWDWSPTEAFGLFASANLTYNRTTYSINTAQNQTFINQNYDVEMNWRIVKGLNFNSTLDYAIYNFRGSDFNQRIPIWNASIAKSFLKNNRGELKLSAVDLLNRNVVINRFAVNNVVQDERIRSLGRYILMTFTYNLKGFGGMPSGGVRVITR
ncbi:MAG: outer membrane beta-barrel protein [Spirosomaceae bacterium]|nr:outer membrane beta-barrel protein [Spirosomataceae bacterium]